MIVCTEASWSVVERTLERIAEHCAVIGVVGLGYVGPPAGARLHVGKGYKVIGLDIDQAKVDAIAAGQELYRAHRPPTADCGGGGERPARCEHRLLARPGSADALIHLRSDAARRTLTNRISAMSISTVESLVPHIRAGQVMSLESTTYPGTTEEELASRGSRGADSRSGKDYLSRVFAGAGRSRGIRNSAPPPFRKWWVGRLRACARSRAAPSTSRRDHGRWSR